MSITIDTRKALRGGWESRTTVDLGNNRLLRIITYRLDNGVLVTRANALKLEDRGGIVMETWALFGDFTDTLAKSKPARVTGAVCEAQHKSALATIDDLKARALAFYAEKNAKASEAA